MVKWIICLLSFLQGFSETIPGYSQNNPNNYNLLRTNNIGTSIFLWAENLESGSEEIRYVTSFANGRFSNYIVFGALEQSFAFNATYDNALNCLLFYSEGNKLIYSYGDPRFSSFSKNKQIYEVQGCNLIYHSQMRFCPTTNKFYIVLTADTGLFFLTYDGTFSSTQLDSNVRVMKPRFNYDTQGNILVVYERTSISSYQWNTYVVFCDKNFSAQTPIDLEGDYDQAVVYQVNSSGEKYWAITESRGSFFLNQAGVNLSNLYSYDVSSDFFFCRQLGELVGFKDERADPELELPARIVVNYYDMVNIDETISLKEAASVDNQQLPSPTYSQFSQKGANIYFASIALDRLLLKNYFLPSSSINPNFLSSSLSLYELDDICFIAGFQSPFLGARLAWFPLSSLFGFYNFEPIFSTLEAFKKFNPIKYKKGI
jgi:hypothetical protein